MSHAFADEAFVSKAVHVCNCDHAVLPYRGWLDVLLLLLSSQPSGALAAAGASADHCNVLAEGQALVSEGGTIRAAHRRLCCSQHHSQEWQRLSLVLRAELSGASFNRLRVVCECCCLLRISRDCILEAQARSNFCYAFFRKLQKAEQY
jgi:hypothetical protein